MSDDKVVEIENDETKHHLRVGDLEPGDIFWVDDQIPYVMLGGGDLLGYRKCTSAIGRSTCFVPVEEEVSRAVDYSGSKLEPSDRIMGFRNTPPNDRTTMDGKVTYKPVESAEDLKPGDSVRLQSGGVEMVVRDLDEKWYYCVVQLERKCEEGDDE